MTLTARAGKGPGAGAGREGGYRRASGRRRTCHRWHGTACLLTAAAREYTANAVLYGFRPHATVDSLQTIEDSVHHALRPAAQLRVAQGPQPAAAEHTARGIDRGQCIATAPASGRTHSAAQGSFLIQRRRTAALPRPAHAPPLLPPSSTRSSGKRTAAQAQQQRCLAAQRWGWQRRRQQPCGRRQQPH